MSLKRPDEVKQGFTFFWKIRHFSWCSKTIDILASPEFCIKDIENSTQWQLWMIFQENDEINISISLTLTEMGPPEMLVDVELFLMEMNCCKAIQKIENKIFMTPGLKFLKSFSRDKILERLLISDDMLTIGCLIKTRSHMLQSVECTGYTDMCTVFLSVKTPISLAAPSKVDTTQSIIIPSTSEGYPDFEIILHIINKNKLKAIELKITDASPPIVTLLKLSLQDTENIVLFSFEDIHKFDVDEPIQEWKICNLNTVLNFSKNDTITLHCRLAISDGSIRNYIENVVYTNSCDRNKITNCDANQSLKEKLMSLYADKELCDFTIQVAGEEFPVHKAVLGAFSPVFRAMFQRDMKEKESSMSVIEGIHADTMKRLIYFAYSEEVGDIQWEDAINLYSAADMYEISELKQKCSEFIISNLNMENFTDALWIADVYQDDYVNQAAASFVQANSREAFRSEKWKVFVENHVSVAAKSMHEICLKMTENFNLKL